MTLQGWSMDPTHSSIAFAVRHMVVAKVRGQFKKYTAKIEIDEEDITRSRLSVVIDAASVDTGSEQRDTHLRSADFFDVATFPELRFDSRRVESLGEGRLKVVGDLTLHGVTREVVLDVEDAGRTQDPWGGTRAGFAARTSIDRRNFGIVYGSGLVGDRVEIEIDVEAVSQATAQRAA